MKLFWLGHACFLVEQDGYTILLDPYTGVEGYPPLYETAVRAANPGMKEGGVRIRFPVRMHIEYTDGPVTPGEEKIYVNRVLCSHGHFDHNAVELTALLPEAPCPFTIRTVETFHDDQGGALRGNNTVHILSAGGVTVAHLGDLGHQLSPEQIAEIGPLDAVLIPVGGTYTVDAAGARAVCEALRPGCVVPMHYRHAPYGLPNVGGVEEFLELWPGEQVHRLDGPLCEITGGCSGVLAPCFSEEG